MRSATAALLLLVVALFTLLPRALTTEYRGTEGRRVQIALEMRESGDLMVPALGREPTLAKPPLFYWTLVGLFGLFEEHKLVARLPAVLGFLGLALVAWRLLLRHHDPATALLGAVLVLAAPALVFDGPTAEIDPLFSALTAVSVLAFAEGVANGRTSAFVAAGLCGGLAMLTKGPPYYLFLAGPLLVALHRRCFRALLIVVPLSLLVPLCYYGPLWLFRVDPHEFARIARQESIGRLAFYGVDNLLDIPPFLLRSLALCAPALVFALLARRPVLGGGAAGRAFGTSVGAAAISGVVLLLFFPGRPTRYLLPAIALANVALAPRVAAWMRATPALAQPVRRAIVAVGILIALVFLAAPLFVRREHQCLVPVLGAVALLLPFVTTRARLVAVTLALPAAVAWAVLDAPLAQGPRLQEAIGPELARVVAREGGPTRFGTLGHVPAPTLLAAHLILPGDEALARPPGAPFLIVEDLEGAPEWDAAEITGYRHLVRFRLTDKSIVVMQKR